MVFTSHHNVRIFNLNEKLSGNLSIRNTICVDVDLYVNVFGENDDEIILNLKLYRWSQLQNLIEQLSGNVKREDCLDLDYPDEFKQTLCDYNNDFETSEFCAANTETEVCEILIILRSPITRDDISDFLIFCL